MNKNQTNSASSSSNESSNDNSNSSNTNVIIDENVQRMIDNNADMHYSNQMVLAQSMTPRPKNTILAYAGKQKEWKVDTITKNLIIKIKNTNFCV